MPTHDPMRFVSSLSQKLATRSRHVCVLLGAGSSRACGLPDIEQLKNKVMDGLSDSDKNAFAGQLVGRNFEQALSRIRRISALLTGEQELDGLTEKSAKDLDLKICQKIVKELDISKANMVPVRQFALWVSRATYAFPVEIFTINYDLLLETAFDKHSVMYFDGFLGTLNAKFQTELVEAVTGSDSEWMPAFFARLWKLHGSVNWMWDESNQVIRLGKPVNDNEPAAIYPSDMKYDESRRFPFVVLHDRLRRALNQPETIALLSGYSFGDQHLNELLYDAVSRRERSEVVAFCYADIPEEVANRAQVTPNLQVIGKKEAIIGGVRGAWEPPENPVEEFWKDGEFMLPDFARLASYLAISGGRSGDRDPSLKELLNAIKQEANDQEGQQ